MPGPGEGYVDEHGRYVRPGTQPPAAAAHPADSASSSFRAVPAPVQDGARGVDGPRPASAARPVGETNRVERKRTTERRPVGPDRGSGPGGGRRRRGRVRAGWLMLLLGGLAMVAAVLLRHAVAETPGYQVLPVQQERVVGLVTGHDYVLYASEGTDRPACTVEAFGGNATAGRYDGITAGIVDSADGLYRDGKAWTPVRGFSVKASGDYGISCGRDADVLLADRQSPPDAGQRARTMAGNTAAAVLWNTGWPLTLLGMVLLGWSHRPRRWRALGRNLILWSTVAYTVGLATHIVVDAQTWNQATSFSNGSPVHLEAGQQYSVYAPEDEPSLYPEGCTVAEGYGYGEDKSTASSTHMHAQEPAAGTGYWESGTRPEEGTVMRAAQTFTVDRTDDYRIICRRTDPEADFGTTHTTGLLARRADLPWILSRADPARTASRVGFLVGVPLYLVGLVLSGGRSLRGQRTDQARVRAETKPLAWSYPTDPGGVEVRGTDDAAGPDAGGPSGAGKPSDAEEGMSAEEGLSAEERRGVEERRGAEEGLGVVELPPGIRAPDGAASGRRTREGLRAEPGTDEDGTLWL